MGLTCNQPWLFKVPHALALFHHFATSTANEAIGLADWHAMPFHLVLSAAVTAGKVDRLGFEGHYAAPPIEAALASTAANKVLLARWL